MRYLKLGYCDSLTISNQMSIAPVIIIAGLLPEEFDIEGVYRMMFFYNQNYLASTLAGFKNR